MSSEKQIAANRSNARRSTGPRSPGGKARVSANALKHGLTGRDVVLPNEDPDAFESFQEDLFTDLAPEGALEVVLAEQIVTVMWRLRRVVILEAAIYKLGLQELTVKKEEEACRRYEPTIMETLRSLEEKTVAECDREAYEDAKRRLESARTVRDQLSLNVARILECSEAALTNLSRYERALYRSRDNTLHELQRLQAMRAGEAVAPPSVMDVNINLADPPLRLKDVDES